MSLNEAISEGLLVTGVGLLIVFSVLIILMLALMAMKALFYKEPQKVVKEDVKSSNVSVASVQPATVENNSNKTDDKEIIAVIAAAIAASLNTSVSNLKIKSLKRIGNNSPVWNKAGVNEMINSRL